MGLYDDSYWDELYGQGSSSGGNSGQIGFSGGTSGNWWDGQTDSNGWMYDADNDEYYRPDEDYSGGDTYPGNVYDVGATFSTNPVASMPRGDIPLIPSQSPNQLSFPPLPPLTIPPPGRTDRPTRGLEQNIGTPKPTPAPAQPAPSSNKPTNVSQTNISSQSLSNALPPIANGSPAPNPETFDPQYIPQSERRRMNPGGMDSGSRMPGYSPGFDPTAGDTNIYDSGPSKSGWGVGLGDGKVMPTSGRTASEDSAAPFTAKDMLTGTLKGITGLDVSSKKGFGDSLLGMTGVNRYRDLLRDPRKKPKPNPYDLK